MAPREESDDDLDDEDEEESPRPRRPPPRPSHTRKRTSRPVRRWRSGEEEEEEEDEEVRPAKRRWFDREKHPVFWRARDSLYFEPLVAVAVVALMLVGLYAYTQNWPPVYVVESDSMQHGSTDVLGVINTGDLVLAQRIPTGQITPYLVGMTSGYSTYGEYGDVVLYLPNGQGTTPIIHRAILFLEWDPAVAGYNATELSGLPCGTGPGDVYSTPGTPAGDGRPAGCGVTGLAGTLDLYRIGWQSVNISLDLSSPELGEHSGFVTMGDYNFNHGCTPAVDCVGLTDQGTGLSELVEPGWIVGVARGMIPWFGALKLALEGNAGSVPAQSWQFLGLTVLGVILLAFGIHYALRAEGIEDPRRRSEEDEDREEEESAPPGRARRFLRGLKPWGRAENEEDEEDALSRRPARPARHDARPSRRGRPVPRVRRGQKPKHRPPASDEADL